MTDYRQTFKHIDVLRLEVGLPHPVVPNLIRNTDGVLGGWGWITPTAGTLISGFGPGVIGGYPDGALRYVTGSVTGGVSIWFASEPVAVVPGRYVGSRLTFNVLDTATTTASSVIEFFDSANVLVSSSGTTGAAPSGTIGHNSVLVPAGVAYARLRVNVIRASTGARDITFGRALLGMSATSADVGSGLTFREHVHSWVNVIGPTHDIEISRAGLDVGTLNATILDATLDPATSATIRPGRLCRVQALADNAWQSLYTGELTHARVNYERVKDGLTRPLTNLIENPSVETTTWGGSASVSRVQPSSTPAGTGTWAMRNTYNGTDTTGQAQFTASTPKQQIDPTKPYSTGCWIRREFSTGMSKVRILFPQYRADGTFIGSLIALASVDLTIGQWTFLRVENLTGWHAEATQVTFAIYPATGFAATTGGFIDLAAAILVQGSSLPDYFDGDTPGCAWTGTPHASTSTRLWDGNPKRVRVELTAIDATTRLANVPRPDGVASITELRAVMEGCGVPWLINGSTAQLPELDPAAIVVHIPAAKALDQIALTRDTVGGHAYVDRRGVLVAYDVPTDPVTPNPGFEVNATGWTAFTNCTIARVTTPTRNGSAGALRMTATAAGNMNALTPFGAAGIAVNAVAPYVVTANFRAATTPRVCRVGLDYYDSAGGYVAGYTSAAFTNNSTGWVQASLAFTSPPNARYVSIVLRVDAPAAGEIHYVDDVIFGGPVFDEDDYSDIDVTFATDDVINEVFIRRLEWEADVPPEDAKTIEMNRGPYVDVDSRDTWGPHSQIFTVNGPGDSAALAASILAKNRTPVMRPNTIQIPILTPVHIATRAMTDLYHAVSVAYAAVGLNAPVRVTSIRHRITTTGWLMTLGLSRPDASAIPRTPPPLQR